MKNRGKVYLFFSGAVRMTLRITLDIYRTTFALFVDAVPLTIAACKPLFIFGFFNKLCWQSLTF
jgi:hypothetical protein